VHLTFDPQISEWGNPHRIMPVHFLFESIEEKKTTWGTETSKYPEEKKSTEIPRVAASESGCEPKPVYV
jgi:hypothetical protein